MYADGVSSANDQVFMSLHTSTHIDAIGHFSKDGRLFGGIDVATHQTGPGGMAAHGIETVQPILRRAVLLDVAGFKDRSTLDPDYIITSKDLEAVARAEGVDLRPGDVVLVRTGWAQFWDDPSVFLGVGSSVPGPTLEGARWLAAAGVSIVGGDHAAFEFWPTQGQVHGFLLAERGIHIIENLNLEELAKEKVYSFLFVALPLRFVGATASPIRPLAIV